MSKTITIAASEYDPDDTNVKIDLKKFAIVACQVQNGLSNSVGIRSQWRMARLMDFGTDGQIVLTPRGEDLLASIDSLPDDPEPEVKTTPCSKCNGSGEQPLFVSMETCDRCDGSKIEPTVKPTSYKIMVDHGRISSNRPSDGSLLRATWKAHPKKLSNGEWGARVLSLACKPGDQIEVVTLSGKKWLSTIITCVDILGTDTIVECTPRSEP